ncbi:MAG: FG-GAP-like repeat-containing protein [Myxococcota bacterium]|nr:FG-GAP-like repeat-containing protein [Myxococcota bacterium]
MVSGIGSPPPASGLCHSGFTLVAWLVVGVLAAAPARGDVPLPAYPDCEIDQDLSQCPAEASGNWALWSHTPAELLGQIRPDEVDLGIGNGVLPAWRLGTGRWDQLIAVADSGIKWRDHDLVNKVFLNVGELPLPQDAEGIEAGSHDRDGNGLVNLRDYSEDPRVDVAAGDWRSDEMLDPSDLIATFSDGIDDDDNGYIDDIAGWDFFEGDNNPFATNEGNHGDHGNSLLRPAGAEGENGGRIGVCPNCALLPIRVGDSFITWGGLAAEAVVFALTHEAAVMAMALGGTTQPEDVGEVMRRAWDSGLLVVAAAGDETSFHRNYPAVDPHTLYVHAIGADQREWESASSFLRFVNCDNFGPRMDLVATTRYSCATGSVAYIAGAAGLLASLGQDLLDEPLSVAETYQLLVTTATDIDVQESRGEDPDPALFTSYPGWDQHFGYGRLNLAAAAQAIADGAIPPVATIESPDWFAWVDQASFDASGVPVGRSAEVVVSGRVSAERAGGWSYELEWGLGSDVPEEDWMPLASGEGTAPFEGELGRLAIGEVAAGEEHCAGGPLDLSDPLAAAGFDAAYSCPPLERHDGILGRLAKLDPYGISFRLTVTDDQGLVGRHRRYIYVRRDPRVLDGYPVALPDSIEGAPALADFDGDGVFEVVIVTSSGRLEVRDGSGAALPGWPQFVGLLPSADPSDPGNHLAAPPYLDGLSLNGRQNVVASPAVAALDGGSGPPDVVVGTLSGELYAWTASGELRPGFPVTMDYSKCDPALRDEDTRTDCGFFASPALVDLDGDGDLEILQPAMDQWLYAWHGDGSPLQGWPVHVHAPSFEAIAHRQGRILSSPAVGDLDGDGDLEIALGTSQTAGSDLGGYGMLYALDHHGAVLPGWPVPLFAGFAGALPYIGEGVVVSPALADIDGDGDLEIGANAIADQGALYNYDGTVAADFSAIQASYGPGSNTDEAAVLMMASNGAFGDLDGDGAPDYFGGASGIGYGGNLLARGTLFDHDHVLVGYSGAVNDEGRSFPLPGFPRQMEDIQFFTAPVVADIGGRDGLEVIAASTLLIRAFDSEGGESSPGFPLFHGGWQLGSPALGDIDGDGWLDIVAATREGLLFAWRTEGRADGAVEWPMFGHDARRTGNYHTPLPLQAGPPANPGCEECGVAGSQDPAAPGSSKAGPRRGLWVLALGFLLFLSRRLRPLARR